MSVQGNTVASATNDGELYVRIVDVGVCVCVCTTGNSVHSCCI